MNFELPSVNPGRNWELRKIVHELSNLTTGVLISSGLLTESLRGDMRRRYSRQITDAGEQCAVLLQQARALLHGEQEVNPSSKKSEPRGQLESRVVKLDLRPRKIADADFWTSTGKQGDSGGYQRS